MNTQKISREIEEVEEELRQNAADQQALADRLAALREQPEPRTPEAGDVWIAALGETVTVDDQNGYTYTEDGYRVTDLKGNRDALKTYLGKHHEVYVKISDVRDALSIKDKDGDSFLKFSSTFILASENYEQGREALAKLGIK